LRAGLPTAKTDGWLAHERRVGEVSLVKLTEHLSSSLRYFDAHIFAEVSLIFEEIMREGWIRMDFIFHLFFVTFSFFIFFFRGEDIFWYLMIAYDIVSCPIYRLHVVIFCFFSLAFPDRFPTVPPREKWGQILMIR
jgi:hypothetical protein